MLRARGECGAISGVTPGAPLDGNDRRLHGYDPAAYGDSLGADYDALYPGAGLETSATVDFLAELALRRPERSVLEFGIGTGRVAFDLHRRGVVVAGIEASPIMLEVFREKAAGAPIHVELGDFLTARVPGCFAVVALIFNNVLDPRGMPALLTLFANAARHLSHGGFFVVEAFVLDDQARDGNWSVSPRYVGGDHVEMQFARFDIETNMVERTLMHLTSEGPRFVSVRDTYASPGELDVVAHVNGLTRVERYSSWTRESFTSHSRRHISVYERLGTDAAGACA